MLLQTFFLAVFIAVVAATEAVEKFSGTIKLYRDNDWKDLLATYKISKANRCYNLAGCGDLNDIVSSAKWEGLPTTATYTDSRSSSAQITFYANSDCRNGYRRDYPTNAVNKQAFGDSGIDRMISSLMILQYANTVKDGIYSMCSLETEAATVTTTTNIS